MINFRRIFLTTWFCYFWSINVTAFETHLSVSSPVKGTVTALKDFGIDLQCFVSGVCLTPKKVKWLKVEKGFERADDQLIAEGTSTLGNDSRLVIRHTADEDKREEEEFTLVISNVSIVDSGFYQCKLDDKNYVEFKLDVLEGGLSSTFTEEMIFDYIGCCQRNGVSEKCLPMCKPKTIKTHTFDPVSCQEEFGKTLLQCASDNGTISHAYCCQFQLVPQLCWDYCSLTIERMERPKHICIFWMKEIYQCYEHFYVPLSSNPENLTLMVIDPTTVQACWTQPNVRPETVQYYTLRFQELPYWRFRGGDIEGGEYKFEEPTLPPYEDESNGNETSIQSPVTTQSSDRHKRQAIVISRNHFTTNTTEVKKYHLFEINTTDTCAYVTRLKPSTRYTMYVKAINSYGDSLPSLRANVITANVDISNSSLPDVQQCCNLRGVAPECVDGLCNVTQLPGEKSSSNIEETCRHEFARAAPCLAGGRDHTQCCLEKNVGQECMTLCNGSSSHLPPGYLLCLTLDMTSIYSCLHQGYVAHPSPPTDVSVNRITSSSALITWRSPEYNADKVISYSLFYREGDHGEYKEMRNAVSPFELDGLQFNESCYVYLIAYSQHGKSLKSTILQFRAAEGNTPETNCQCQWNQMAITIIFVLACVVIGATLYFTRLQKPIANLVQKLCGAHSAGRENGDTVAFENLGYGKEAQVHVLQCSDAYASNPIASGATASEFFNGWQMPKFDEFEKVAPKKLGMQYMKF